jgi:hypothetical protein
LLRRGYVLIAFGLPGFSCGNPANACLLEANIAISAGNLTQTDATQAVFHQKDGASIFLRVGLCFDLDQTGGKGVRAVAARKQIQGSQRRDTALGDYAFKRLVGRAGVEPATY